MKANELRIGNYLNSPFGIGQVTGIQDREVTEVDEIGYIIEETPPIPLTEEWLLKFGFEKIKKPKGPIDMNPFFDVYHLKGDDPWSGFRITFYRPDDHYFKVSSSINYKYVHQLQNLYFALTGEELTIKKQSNNNEH